MTKEKVKKNLFIPAWVSEMIDQEGDLLGGKQQGTVISAAILMFVRSEPELKAKYIREVQDIQLAEAYNLKSPAKKLAESIVDEAVELAKKKKAAKVAAK